MDPSLFTISPRIRAEMVKSGEFHRRLKGKQIKPGILRMEPIYPSPYKVEYIDTEPVMNYSSNIDFNPVGITKSRPMTKDEIIGYLETKLSLVVRKFDKIKDYLGPEMYDSIIELEEYLEKYREES